MGPEHHHPTHWLRSRHRRRTAGLAAAAALAAAVLARPRLRRVVVAGESMLPAFRPGDRLLVGPVGRLRAGHVVAVADPRHPDRLLVKRVVSAGPGPIVVHGDNEAGSTDSRHFGPVPRHLIAGRVVYRYAPPGRVGWWPE